MRRVVYLNPVARALIVRDWDACRVDAEIAAYMSDNSDSLVNKAGRRFYVILGAAILAGLHHDDPDIRIVRGAVNATHDQAGEPEVVAARRASIVSGLQAVSRLQDRIERRHITASAVDMAKKLTAQHVHLSDFEKLVERMAT